jgi:hypothetical protein
VSQTAIAAALIEFWQTGNRWRLVAYPGLFIGGLFVLFGDAQCFLLVFERAWLPIYFAMMFVVWVVEVTAPSSIHNMVPAYTDGQRASYGLLHAFAWTSFAFGIAKLWVVVIC